MSETHETFDTEALLKDILAVIRKHGLPIQTVSLDVSMFDDDFDTVIPRLKTYKSGAFHRPMTIDGVSILFDAKRRIPFADLTLWLEQHILPPTQAFGDELKNAYPNYNISFDVAREDSPAPIGRAPYYFQISTACRFSDALYDNYNILQLSIHLRQRDSTVYPQLNAWVAWLNDYEPMGEYGTWGVDEVYKQSFEEGETLWSMFEKLEKSLPTLYDKFRAVIEERSKA